MTRLFKLCCILICCQSIFLGVVIADETTAPAERSEDVPNLGNYPASVGEASGEKTVNHPPQVFLTADPGWSVIEGTTTVSSPANQQVAALIVAHGYDEDGDPLEYTFINHKTGRVVGPGKENWVVVSPYEPPGSYPGKVIVKDLASGQTAEANFEVVVRATDEDETTQAKGNESAVAKRDIIKKGQVENDTSEPSNLENNNVDLLNCLCRCVKPEKSDFDCSYNLTPYPTILGGSPSCGDLKNGPCICQAIGCFRAPLPTSGKCYNACRDQYPGVPVLEPASGTKSPTEGAGGPSEPESNEDHSPGNLVPSASMVYAPEKEPNDQIGDANEIKFASPVGVKGRITPAGDVDFFRFNINSAGMLKVEMDQIPDEMRTRIDLYGKNFNWMTRKDASSPGDKVTLLVDIPGAGQGFIAISDLERKAHPSDYSFVAEFLSAEDVGEPNDRVGDATEISFDKKVDAHICPVGDVDFYKIYVDSAGILDAKLDQVPSDMKSRIDLYNKNFDWITRKDASNPGDTITMEVALPGPAVHYLAISDLDRKAHSDSYSIQATFQSAPDSNEPNDQVGESTEVGLGQTISAYICPIDDVDFYKLQVDAPAILEAKLERVPSAMKARIDLYGKNLNWITRKDASNAGDAITLEKDLGERGVYYLAVTDLERKAHIQDYQLMAELRSG